MSRPARIALASNPLHQRLGADDEPDIPGGVHVESPIYEPSPARLPPDDDGEPSPAEASSPVTLAKTPNLWRNFPSSLDWGQYRLPEFIECEPIAGRAYWHVLDFEAEARNWDFNLVDYGIHGSPGWVVGIGPVILKAAYPRELGYGQKPWWFVIQKILPFPSQLQASAPILLVPAQLVTMTSEEVVMWGVRGTDEEVEEDDMTVTEADGLALCHGVIDELTMAEFPIIHKHTDVDTGSLKRFAHAWRHACPLIAESLLGGGEKARHPEVPQSPYAGLDQLMKLDKVVPPPLEEYPDTPAGTIDNLWWMGVDDDMFTVYIHFACEFFLSLSSDQQTLLQRSLLRLLKSDRKSAKVLQRKYDQKFDS